MTFSESMVIYRRSCFVPKRKEKHTRVTMAANVLHCQREIQKIRTGMSNSYSHPYDIVEVRKYNPDIPDERFFFDKVHYGSSSGKKVSAGKICLYARIHFSKRVIAIHNKDQGKEQMFL